MTKENLINSVLAVNYIGAQGQVLPSDEMREELSTGDWACDCDGETFERLDDHGYRTGEKFAAQK